MATIKITTQGDNDRFNHNGLTVTRAWTELDLDSLSDETAQALIEYTGRFVRVHDEDLDAFKSWLASRGGDLKYEDGRVVDSAREKREQEEHDRQARGTQPGTQPTGNAPRAASGTLPGQPPGPTPTRDDARDRHAPITEPDRPKNKPR